MNDKITNIRKILIDIIDEKYPEIPKDVVDKILNIQLENIDNRANAAALVASYIEQYLNNNLDA